jgi:hypothetical protein
VESRLRIKITDWPHVDNTPILAIA